MQLSHEGGGGCNVRVKKCSSSYSMSGSSKGVTYFPTANRKSHTGFREISHRVVLMIRHDLGILRGDGESVNRFVLFGTME